MSQKAAHCWDHKSYCPGCSKCDMMRVLNQQQEIDSLKSELQRLKSTRVRCHQCQSYTSVEDGVE